MRIASSSFSVRCSVDETTFAVATPADLTAVRALLDRCGLPTGDLKAKHLEQFVVCRVGGQLAGAIGLEVLGSLGLLRSLAVAPEFRGRRLAHALWTRLQDEAPRRGIRQLYLLTTTADGLFSRWGFRRVGRDVVPDAVRATAEYSALCPSDAAVMIIDLMAPPDQRVL
jgi:amino-acid N-acetyltransferase